MKEKAKQGKKILLIAGAVLLGAVAAFCIWMAAMICLPSRFSGSRTGNPRELLIDYKVMNITDTQQLSAKVGDVLHAEIVAEAGSIDVQLVSESGQVLYEENEITTSQTMDIPIEQTGLYTLQVTGDQAKGSAHFTFNDE